MEKYEECNCKSNKKKIREVNKEEQRVIRQVDCQMEMERKREVRLNRIHLSLLRTYEWSMAVYSCQNWLTEGGRKQGEYQNYGDKWLLRTQ